MGATSAAVATSASPGPALETLAATLEAALACPATFDHPDREPVLLVHGTGTNPEESWSWSYGAALPGEGFDVCTVALPDRAMVDIHHSTEYVVHAIRVIAERSGRQVDVIGHSQGSLQPRWAIRWWPDVVGLVDDYISLAGANHGVQVADMACEDPCPPAAWQLRHAPSAFLAALNAGDETPGDVSYTSIWSETDELVQPVDPPTAALEGASNIVVQDLCPGRPVQHVAILHDAVVWSVVLDTLRSPGPADVSDFDALVCLEGSAPGMSPVTGDAVLYGRAALAQITYERIPAEPPLRAYASGAAPGTPDEQAAPEAVDPTDGGEPSTAPDPATSLPATGGAGIPGLALLAVGAGVWVLQRCHVERT